MPNFVEGIDDPLATDGNTSFGGGVDMQVDPGILEQTASAELKNMAMNRFGVLQTRKGTDAIGDANPFAATIQALCELDTPTVEQLIAVSAGVFKKLVSTTWTTIAGWTAHTTAKQIDKLHRPWKFRDDQRSANWEHSMLAHVEAVFNRRGGKQ
jgi:hypothetical protein